MIIQAINDNIFIELDEQIRTTKSGIILADMAIKERPRTGKVISIGKDNNGLKENDRILYKKYEFKNIEIENKKCVYGKVKDILAVIPEDMVIEGQAEDFR